MNLVQWNIKMEFNAKIAFSKDVVEKSNLNKDSLLLYLLSLFSYA